MHGAAHLGAGLLTALTLLASPDPGSEWPCGSDEQCASYRCWDPCAVAVLEVCFEEKRKYKRCAAPIPPQLRSVSAAFTAFGTATPSGAAAADARAALGAADAPAAVYELTATASFGRFSIEALAPGGAWVRVLADAPSAMRAHVALPQGAAVRLRVSAKGDVENVTARELTVRTRSLAAELAGTPVEYPDEPYESLGKPPLCR